VDWAFSSEMRQVVYKSYQSKVGNQGRVWQNSQEQKKATAVRQLSEWGMRGLQASFPRLKDRITWEMGGEWGAMTCSGDDFLPLQFLCITGLLESDPISVYTFATKECQHI
jgi:hypothetical protein